MIIIGITGTLGAGKGTIVEYLVNEKDFVHFSVREYLSEVIRERGMEVNRDTMVVTANDLRSKNGPGFIIEELYRKAAATRRNCIIESIRTPGEIEKLRKKKRIFSCWLLMRILKSDTTESKSAVQRQTMSVLKLSGKTKSEKCILMTPTSKTWRNVSVRLILFSTMTVQWSY
jgi:adenylate kinase family enzyme